MQHQIVTRPLSPARAIPRAWLITLCATGSWALLALAWWAASSLFQFILASL